MQKLVLTAIGADRPGLVQALSSAVDAHGGNWLESEFLHLAGQFAGIALVAVPPAEVEGLRTDAAGLRGSVGLDVVLTAAGHPDAPRAPEVPADQPVRIHVLGHDRPGVVRQVTSALAGEGVTIHEFSSWTHPAPEGGGVLFEAEATVRLPEGGDPSLIREVLEPIAAELMVDLDFS